mgnify:CR=1 FL=1
MRIQSPPPTGIPQRPPLSRLPSRTLAHDNYSPQEDILRVGARTLGTLARQAAANSRTLSHVADATGTLGIQHTGFHVAMGAASLGLGAIDGVQAYHSFKEGDKVMASLNLGGGLSNLAGGAISLTQAFAPGLELGNLGAAATGGGVLFDAVEDFVDAKRLEKPELRQRGLVKSAGAGLLLAGAVTGNPALQILGNFVALGGVSLHYLPSKGQSPPCGRP